MSVSAAMPLSVAAELRPSAVPAPCSVIVARESDAAAWDACLAARPDATGYHEWAWRRVFTQAFGHEPIYLLARRDDAVAGVLPLVFIRSLIFGRSLTSLPFLNYGGIVADSPEAANALLDAAAAVARDRRCRYVELRHVARRFPKLPCKQHKVAMELRLAPGLWERLDRKVRNQVRKAQKSELTVETGGVALLPEFYGVFARNMRDLGTPVYASRFFAHVLHTFSGRARLHVVRLAGKPMAAGLTYRTGPRLEIPWASSIRDYNALCPNHLLYWSILEGAIADGVEVFDFGRSTPNEGTYRFKEQWGAKPVWLHWEYALLQGTTLPNASPTNPKFQLAIKLWQKLPVSIATRVGPSIVRAIP
jgi:FemAB-related protein (PEP-CTERM system-associated)